MGLCFLKHTLNLNCRDLYKLSNVISYKFSWRKLGQSAWFGMNKLSRDVFY